MGEEEEGDEGKRTLGMGRCYGMRTKGKKRRIKCRRRTWREEDGEREMRRRVQIDGKKPRLEVKGVMEKEEGRGRGRGE